MFGTIAALAACGGGATDDSAASEDGDIKLTVTTWNYDTTPEFENYSVPLKKRIRALPLNLSILLQMIMIPN